MVGASGYVGQRLCRLLEGCGCAVFGTHFRHNLPDPRSVFLDVKDERAATDLIGETRPDVVFYLACDPNDLSGSIIDGTRNLLRALQPLPKACRFLFLSTDAVFDGESPPYRESDIPLPIYAYGKAKRSAELEVLLGGGTVVRTSLVYGFDPEDKRTAMLLDGLKSGTFGHPYFREEVRCPIYAADLCSAMREIAFANAWSTRLVHIAGPERLCRYDFARKIAFLLGFDASRIPAASLRESGITRPRDVSLETALAHSIMKTRIRSIEEVISSRLSDVKGGGA